MDYAEMNLGSWASHLGRFKDLVRPMGVDALGQPDETVESVRSGESASILVSTVSGRLPDLVFEGYRDWYSYPDEWVLRNLGHVLTTGEEDQILSGLDQGTSDALLGVLGYIEGRLGAWQAAAAAEFAAGGETGMLEGTANTENWTASRTPGTFYYTYSGDRYLYSDLAQAEMSEWETLPVREQLAADNAQPWGASGWFFTPAGEPGLYGGAFVYAPDRGGPWMTQEQAEAALAGLAGEAAAAGGVATDPAAEAITEAGTVDLSTPEQAQEAADDVASAAQEIINNVLRRNPQAAEGIDPERIKQLALEALRAQQ